MENKFLPHAVSTVAVVNIAIRLAAAELRSWPPNVLWVGLTCKQVLDNGVISKALHETVIFVLLQQKIPHFLKIFLHREINVLLF
jgi:hypothetical protein